MKKPRALLADSSALTRDVLVRELEMLGFDVVAVAKNSEEALGKSTQYHPDVSLIDLELEGEGGIEVIRAITRCNPALAVVVLMPEHMDDPDIIVEAVRAGARAYIRKAKSDKEMKAHLTKLLKRREQK